MKALIKKFHKSGSANDPSCFDLVEVKVGDTVWFKSDHEQIGKVVEIRQGRTFGGNHIELVLENPHGFSGDYLRYATHTTERADDCWV